MLDLKFLQSKKGRMSQGNKKRHFRSHLFNEQNGKCHYCKCDTVLPTYTKGKGDSGFFSCSPNTATLDHLVPVSRGGKTNLKNLVMACYACNQKRGTADPTILEEKNQWKSHMQLMEKLEKIKEVEKTLND